MKLRTDMSLVTRFSLQMGILIVIAFTILVSTVVVLVRQNVMKSAEEQASASARCEALEVSRRLNAGASTAIGLATATEMVAGTASNDRLTINALLANALKKNPDVLAVWCVFERDVLYSPDSKYINTPWGNDVGRFTSGMNKERGTITRDVTLESEMLPGEGDWYLIPKRNAKDTLVDPYMYAYYKDTPEQYETSYAIPILRKGEVIGVAGADIKLDPLKEIAAKIKPYGTGYAAIIANNCTYATHIKEPLVGKDIGNSPEMKKAKEAIAAGSQIEFTIYDKTIGGDAYVVLVPIKVGEADANWALWVAYPIRQAMAPVTRLVWTCLLITVPMVGLLLLAVAGLAKLIARPIRRLRDVADRLAAGDVDKASELMQSP